jgi:hypothetical protein
VAVENDDEHKAGIHAIIYYLFASWFVFYDALLPFA